MNQQSMFDYDLVCFSHLRWDFVFQRPQHLLSRFASITRVFYIEEPIYDSDYHYNDIRKDTQTNVHIVVPHLGSNLTETQAILSQKMLVDGLLQSMKIEQFITWYYSPMFYPFSDHLTPVLKVYDCMDELSAFRFAPESLRNNETRLMQSADLVFTGGQSLYEAKRTRHNNIHPFPSSIDKAHFMKARSSNSEPEDQRQIPGPKLGYYGVIDERIDLDLVRAIAEKRPDWNFIYIGPVVKIDSNTLPKRDNIHYLGRKAYGELPLYLSGWDVAMMPFMLNESTRFISPTKTPEYLAGGKPVISTPIADVVHPYGTNNLVHIAFNAREFIEAAEYELGHKNDAGWLGKVDHHLSFISWDRTWKDMTGLIDNLIRNKHTSHITKIEAYV